MHTSRPAARPEHRPNVPMSQEESHVLNQITRDVALLAQDGRAFRETVEGAITEMGKQIGEARTETRDLAKSFIESRQFGWGKAISMITGLGVIFGVAGTILRLQNENAAIPTNTAVVQLAETVRQLNAEAEKTRTRLDAGKDARLAWERDQAVKNALQDERIGESYFAKHRHYPR